MKSLLKLTRGELFKLIKSKTLYIMMIMLAAVIAIMSVVYATKGDDLGKLIDMMYGETVNIDAFDILDGNLDPIRELAAYYGIDIAALEKIAGDLKDKTEIKTALLNVDPVVMQKISSSLTPGSDYAGIGNIQIRIEFAKYITYQIMQDAVSKKYYKDYINTDDVVNERLERLMEYLVNGGEYGRTVVDFLQLEMRELETRYVALTKKHGAFAASGTQSDFKALLDAFYNFARSSSDFNYFTRSNAMSTNFLLIPTEGFVSVEYSGFRESVKPLTDSAYSSLVTAYNNLRKEQREKNTAAKFLIDFNNAFNGTNEPFTADNDYDLSSKYKMLFVQALNTLVGGADIGGTVNAQNKLFYFYNPEMRQSAEEYLAGNVPSDPAERQKVKEYIDLYALDKPLETDPMLPAKKVLELSYKGEITQEIYEKEYKPYYDEAEKPALKGFRDDMEEQSSRYSQVDLIMAMVPANLRGSHYKLPAAFDSDKLYRDMKTAFKNYDTRTLTINKLVINVNLLESINANRLRDEDAKKIQGFITSSRYKLQSNITQTQFLISNGYLASSYVAPEKMTGAYGYMQFVFILSGIVILIFGIVLAAGAIAGEHSDGTMKLLLIRPHRRWQVLLSKFISVVIVLLAMFILNFLLTVVFGAFWGYATPMALSIVNSQAAVVMHPLTVIFLYHVFGFLEAVIFALIALTLSTCFKSRSGAISVSMLVYFVSFVLGSVLSNFGWYRYVIFNNTNLTQYISSQGPALADMNMLFSLIINALYIIGLSIACFVTFNKRDAT